MAKKKAMVIYAALYGTVEALPRKELHQAAEELWASQAALIGAGEPTIE